MGHESYKMGLAVWGGPDLPNRFEKPTSKLEMDKCLVGLDG